MKKQSEVQQAIELTSTLEHVQTMEHTTKHAFKSFKSKAQKQSPKAHTWTATLKAPQILQIFSEDM